MNTKVYPNFWQSSLYVSVLIIFSLLYFIVLYSISPKITNQFYFYFVILGKILVFLPVIFFLKRRSGVILKNQLFKPKLSEIMITLFTVCLLFLLHLFFSYANYIDKNEKTLSGILNTIFLTPVFEEVFFRGLIFHQLLKRYKAIEAILFSSFLFTLLHLDLRSAFTFFVFSIVVSLLYYKFKQSLIISIIFHIVWNFLTTFV